MQKYWVAGLLALLLGVASTLGWRAEQGRKEAESRLHDLQLSMGAKDTAVAAPPTAGLLAEKSAAMAERRLPAARTSVDIAPYLKMIDDLRLKTRDLDRDLHEARVEAAAAEAKATEKSEDVGKLSAQLANIREEGEAARRRAEVYEADLKVKSQRLIQAETAEKILQERLSKSELAGRRGVVVSKEMEDLNRRRETALTALQRRYRELTDLYRNFSLSAQTRESSGSSLQAGDLSRIQTALQQAEEELRHLQTLNARVAELARVK